MNPKKGFFNLFISGVLIVIIAGIGALAKFGSRILNMNHKLFTHEWENLITFTTSDYVFIACVVLVCWIWLCIYWLYTTVYVVYKAQKVGTNAWLFGMLTLFTNLFGLACLWVYILIYQVCPGCGKLQPRKANNCSLCGTAIYIKCPDCGSRISIMDKYCNGCGKKMK